MCENTQLLLQGGLAYLSHMMSCKPCQALLPLCHSSSSVDLQDETPPPLSSSYSSCCAAAILDGEGPVACIILADLPLVACNLGGNGRGLLMDTLGPKECSGGGDAPSPSEIAPDAWLSIAAPECTVSYEIHSIVNIEQPLTWSDS